MLKKIFFRKNVWICISVLLLSVLLTTCGSKKSHTDNSYSVVYNGNTNTTGTVPTDTTDYANSATVTVLGNTGSLAKTGYVFGGWDTQSDGNGTVYVQGQNFTISSDTTLYAKWLTPNSTDTFSIYSIGDSTMADYDNTTYTLGTGTERRGWGMTFPQFISNPNVTFVNKGISGRSSRDYYNDVKGYWTGIKSTIKAGDYVFIQFAHNDENYGGLTTEEATAAIASGATISLAENTGTYGRGNEAWGTYHDYLTKYVQEAKALGAIPILVGPIVRLGSTPLSAKNCHDLTDDGSHLISNVPGPYTTYTSADYVSAMKDVATKENCSYIDLTGTTKAMVEAYGQAESKNYIYNPADNTHLSAYGATLYSQLVAQELINKGIIAASLKASGLVASYTSWDFGTKYINSTTDKGFSVRGLGLSPDAGSVTITAPDQYLVSTTTTGTFSSSIQLSYTGGAMPPTTFYLRYAPTASGASSGNVTIASSDKTANIAVSGTCITVSNAKAITAYSFVNPAVVGAIDETNKKILVLIPSGTSLSSLVANFTLSAKASATVGSTAQVSGTTSNDFTSSVVYTITAEDLSTTSYTVSVSSPTPGTIIRWLFSDAGWPYAAGSGLEADGTYNGITSFGCSTVATAASSSTSTLAGVSTTFTVRWQIPKNGSTTSGYLAIPVIGPCTVYVTAKSGSSATRNMIITDKTTPTTYPLTSTVSDNAYTYTGSTPGTIYVYTTDTVGASSLYGLAVKY